MEKFVWIKANGSRAEVVGTVTNGILTLPDMPPLADFSQSSFERTLPGGAVQKLYATTFTYDIGDDGFGYGYKVQVEQADGTTP